MTKTIILSTGGTGGHIFPALRLSEELRSRGHRVILLTDQRGQKYQEGASFDGVYMMNLHKGSGLIAKVLQLLDIAIQTVKACLLYRRMKPDLVIGFGGYTSAPALMAAYLSRIPFMVHEQNAVLGRVNRWMAPYANLLALGFDSTRGVPEKVKTNFVGNPVRDDILAGGGIPKTPTEKIRLFVFGGSQGATLFSTIVPQAIAQLPESMQVTLEIVLQSREESLEKTRYDLKKTHSTIIAVQPFFTDIPQQLSQADLIIARSGAMTVSEISAMGRATLFVPLKIAMDNHQFYNVEKIREAKAAWVILEDDFTPENLSRILMEILKNPYEMDHRGQAIRHFSTPDSTVKLAKQVENLVTIV